MFLRFEYAFVQLALVGESLLERTCSLLKGCQLDGDFVGAPPSLIQNAVGAPPHAKIFHVIKKLREDARLRYQPIHPTQRFTSRILHLSYHLVVIESTRMNLSS